MNFLNSKDLGLGGNATGLLNLTLGARNDGIQNGISLSSAGFDVSASAQKGLMDSHNYLAEGFQRDAGALHYLDYMGSKEGQARISYVDLGLDSKNAAAMKTSQELINREKDLAFDLTGAGHFGRADIAGNTIRLNEDAVNISADTLGKAGFYTSVMAREGFLLDSNNALGIGHLSDQQMKDSGLGGMLSQAAFGLQSGVMADLAANAGIKFDGVWGKMRDRVNYVSQTGDISEFDETGRDFRYKVKEGENMGMIARRLGMPLQQYNHFIDLNKKLGHIQDPGIIQTGQGIEIPDVYFWKVNGLELSYVGPKNFNSYIFYDKDSFEQQALALKKRLDGEGNDNSVILVGVNSGDELIKQWSNVLSTDNNSLIRSVYVLAHGDREGIYINRSGINIIDSKQKDQNGKYNTPAALEDYNISMLYLYTCNGANLNYTENVANKLAMVIGSNVWAYDGKLSYNEDNSTRLYNLDRTINVLGLLSSRSMSAGTTRNGLYRWGPVFYQYNGGRLNRFLISDGSRKVP